jgi:hypothetical protein
VFERSGKSFYDHMGRVFSQSGYGLKISWNNLEKGDRARREQTGRLIYTGGPGKEEEDGRTH